MLIGVFGTGRNGSSLIGRLLDGLGDTYVHPVEEKFLTAFEDLSASGRVSRLVEQNCTVKKLGQLGEKVEIDRLAAYYDRNSLSEIHQHIGATLGLPAEIEQISLKGLLGDASFTAEEFTRAYLTRLGRVLRPDVQFEHQLFKSIETAYIDVYESLFADMRFIHIMRDPVAVCSSQKRSLMENKALPASYLGYDWLSCMLDKRWVPHAQMLRDRVSNERHAIVTYEALVRNPKTEIARLAEQLGVEAPPRPDVQTVFHDLDKSSWGGNPSKKNVATPTEVVADLQDRNQYTEVLSAREIDVIAYKTSGLLDLFGYESPSRATRAKLLFQYLLLDKWEWMHWRSPRLMLRGLFGILYRRIQLFR